MDDAALVQGLIGRDKDAQYLFWHRFWPRVYPICVRILRDKPDAVDLTVDVLTDFMGQRVLDIDKPGAMGAYLRLMAVRRALDAKIKQTKSISLDFDIADGSAQTPEEQADVERLMPYLDRCLTHLNDKARQTLRLKYTEQWTNEHIGQIVGGSKQYIGRLIRQSLELLRSCIEKKAQNVT